MISHYILAAKLFKKNLLLYIFYVKILPPPVQLNVFTNVIPNTLHL